MLWTMIGWGGRLGYDFETKQMKKYVIRVKSDNEGRKKSELT